MLKLGNIVKIYQTGDMTVEALNDISLEFRKSEFVSILGPSGCGKTTMLNIIGGLDRYTKGELSIDGKSTKKFTDNDWDTYRNNSVGFVFQTYNLIPHQSVLANVELALTLSGVSKSERRRRAVKVLEEVGLGSQLYKKPNQLSGGQMQRVAIARALVNNPDILLADEPTGALDSETSIQIMEILKKISKDRLVIMVTHNPDLAQTYSTRIIKLLDGRLIEDSNPYHSGPEPASSAKKPKKTYMSFFTALNLSLNNLMTKKTRTFMTSFAGSIGIIGIALILALSSGVRDYIADVQEETLSSYPLSIQEQSVDMISLLSAMSMSEANNLPDRTLDKIYSSNIMGEMISIMLSNIESNNLAAFKEYLESEESKTSGIASYANAIQYGYKVALNIYNTNSANGLKQVNPNTLFDEMGVSGMMGANSSPFSPTMSSMDVWEELLGDTTLMSSRYEIAAGRLPTAHDEIIIIADKNNQISDFTLYSLGLIDSSELIATMQDLMKGKEIDGFTTKSESFTYDELLKLTFKLVPETDYYKKIDDKWVDMREDPVFLKQITDNAVELKIVGIVRTTEENSTTALRGGIGYTSALTEYLIDAINNSEIVKQQIENPEVDIFTGKPFPTGGTEFDITTLPAEQQAYLASLPEEERQAMIEKYAAAAKNTYENNLRTLSVVDLDHPSII
ncbi:MAG: ABC transporter ATP-binding protein, partial [Clostridiales bacterium]|nr:ABC transporter ATP-binding protein [Clostridiales bacterium]